MSEKASERTALEHAEQAILLNSILAPRGKSVA